MLCAKKGGCGPRGRMPSSEDRRGEGGRFDQEWR